MNPNGYPGVIGRIARELRKEIELQTTAANCYTTIVWPAANIVKNNERA